MLGTTMTIYTSPPRAHKRWDKATSLTVGRTSCTVLRSDYIKLLIGTSPAAMGPGFFVPTRNGDLLRWLFDNGFRAIWPAMLMTRGPYSEGNGVFMPSIAF